MSTNPNKSKSKQPIIAQHNNNNERSLTFTLENCDVSIANSIRRVVVSEINQYVFRTFPHSENRADFTVNTTRLHNEILKQRLGCIPIHHLHTIDGFGNEYKNYVVEVDVKNDTDAIRYVTTEDFKVKKIKVVDSRNHHDVLKTKTLMTCHMTICLKQLFEKYSLLMKYQVSTLNLQGFCRTCLLQMQAAEKRLLSLALLKFQMQNLMECIMWHTRALTNAVPM